MNREARMFFLFVNPESSTWETGVCKMESIFRYTSFSCINNHEYSPNPRTLSILAEFYVLSSNAFLFAIPLFIPYLYLIWVILFLFYIFSQALFIVFFALLTSCLHILNLLWFYKTHENETCSILQGIKKHQYLAFFSFFININRSLFLWYPCMNKYYYF